jgi:hypothetical protein
VRASGAIIVPQPSGRRKLPPYGLILPVVSGFFTLFDTIFEHFTPSYAQACAFVKNERQKNITEFCGFDFIPVGHYLW